MILCDNATYPGFPVVENYFVTIFERIIALLK